jgi:hypothetical protein
VGVALREVVGVAVRARALIPQAVALTPPSAYSRTYLVRYSG